MFTPHNLELHSQLEPIRKNEVARFLKKSGLGEHPQLEDATRSFLERIIQAATGQDSPSQDSICKEAVLALFSRPEGI